MDFDTAKENIQPLKGGRRADRLETALGGEKDLLEHERKEHEEAIENYSGLDPLDCWYNYICWIEQSYPKSGNESGLNEAVSKCILKFENDMRYRQDRRLIKLFIKYIDTQDNPHELYEQLFNSGIGTMVSDLYIAWSYYYDAASDFKKAELIFQKGFSAGAQPYDELAQAHQAFSISVTQRMLYDDDVSKKQFQVTMDEKRNALTSLRVYNKKFVGSLRVGSAVKNDNPGRVPVNENYEPNNQQQKVTVLRDEAIAEDVFPGASGIKSIFDISKKTENVHEAGPWNKASKTSKNKLFDSKSIGSSSQPGFCIMEDESLPPITCKNKLFEQGCILPPNFVSKNKPQNPWNIPVVVEEPTAPKTIACYDKFMLYPSPEIEISLEEWRGYRWFKSRDISATIIQQLAYVFENKYEHGARIIPGFISKNVKQDNEKYPLDYDVNNNGYQFPIKKMISSDRTTEYSNEELLAEKFKRGEIKLVKNDDFEETILDDDNMDMTVIGDRRQSVYCISRKSIVPRKSCLRKSIMQPVIEDDNKQEVVIKQRENHVRFEEPITEESENVEDKRPLLKRKLEIDLLEENTNIREKSTSPEPKRLSADEEFFKTPALPPVKPVFEVFEEEENNETFSTQKFNFFIKQQSVSTPINKKTVPRLVPLSTAEQASPKDLQKPELLENIISIESTIHPNALQKQLSTIAEVTESSNSTKSSVSQLSGENEAESQLKSHSKISPVVAGKKWDECSQNPINLFRIPEEQTETTPFIRTLMLPKLKDLQQTPMKMPSFKIFEESLQPIELPMHNESIKIVEEQKVMEVLKLSETIQNVENSFMFIPSVVLDSPEHEEIPATQDVSMNNIEIPATQDVTLTNKNDKGDEFDVPSLSDNTLKQLNEFEVMPELDVIPATQQMSTSLKNKSQEFQVPTIQETLIESPQLEFLVPDIQNLSIQDDIEIPATQELTVQDSEEIPATQEFTFIQPDLIRESCAASKVPFSVYEDSVCEIPQISIKPVSNQSTSNMSRKENLIIHESIKRSNSDEFLELISAKSPQVIYKSGTAASEPKSDISDLLKFSDAKSKLSLEASFGELQINKQQFNKSPSPTMVLEADLNTEKFNMPLKFGKNSTIIGDTFKVSPVAQKPDNSFNLSIEMDENELERLKNSQKQDENVFKVPMLPPPVAPKIREEASDKKKEEFAIFEDDEQDDDLSKSIYHNNKKDVSIIEHEDAETWEDDKMCSFIAEGENRYEYTIIQHDHTDSLSFKLREAIASSKGNPFSKEIRNLILEQCNFELYLEEHVDSCTLIKNIPQLKAGGSLQCGDEEYKVAKIVGKGGFGAVFEVRNVRTNESFAAKQEKPPNMWEYFVLIELSSRLRSKNISHMVPAYMNAYKAIIGNNSSILISEFSPFGTIIDVCNKIKVITGRNVDEYVGMIFASQILSIMDYLHSCHIIHADIKPDNFLLMSKIDIGMKVPALQLIDFGSAIDMESFEKDDKFTYVVKTENFTCCEMLESKPWTYQTDLFGLCGTVHVILFGKYMEVEKKLNNWQIKTKFPRYFQKYHWDIFFNTLLNVPDCMSMPNLQNVKQQLDEEIISRQKYILDKVKEFNNALVSS